jgi:DNA primase
MNTSDRFFDRKAWGLPEETNPETGKERRVWVPAGLVVPTIIDGEVCRIRIRREDPTDGNRYVTVIGSSKKPMLWGHIRCVVVVESDLDGILISQEAGDIVSVIALGSASLRPDADTHAFLEAAETILVALDSDEAGSRQAWKWWPKHYGAQVKRWPVPTGKDPGEAYQSGLDIRAWIVAGLPERIETKTAHTHKEAEPSHTRMASGTKCLGEPCPYCE